MKQTGFPYATAQQMAHDARQMGLSLPFSEDVSVLKLPVTGSNFTLPNALCVQPMEGNDANEEGGPSELSTRRYLRYAKGGAGLIWIEAVSVNEAGRGVKRQLQITKENVAQFTRLREDIQRAAQEAGLRRPLLILQLTHSGRNTTGVRVAASHHKIMNPHQGLPMDYPIITDAQLRDVQEDFVTAAQLCKEAGFDGVDIKCCHLYLFSELASAYTREGDFGGSLDNRLRMELETLARVKAACGQDFIYAARINAFDGMPGGFCTREDGLPDYEEALILAKRLHEGGVTLLNITMGTPYYNPHVNRPFASYPKGQGYEPPEAPLVGVSRLLTGCRVIQEAFPMLVCVATGLSYLRAFGAQVAAGLVQGGYARCVGLGRMAFAYPDFANDIFQQGGMRQEKSCLTCGLCTYLMRGGCEVGCPVRDREVYFPMLKDLQRRLRS